MASVTYTIPDGKLAEFKLGFLNSCPPTPEWGGTDNEWIKEWGKLQFMRHYRVGKLKIRDEAQPPVYDEGVII